MAPNPAQPNDRWLRVKEIAGAALELPPAEREGYVREACAGDEGLRAEVEQILRADAAAERDFLRPLSVEITIPPERPEAEAGALVGKRIGRYRIKRLIGVGGMGAVYEALQEQPRRTVALKVMRAGIATRSSLRRFEYEAQLLGRLRHPGVAQVFEAGTHEALTGPVPYFAMEYIPGATPLTEYAVKRGLHARERLELFQRVCDAVHHGHQKAIVHRDLKPSNILVDSSGDPKIIDFGVARATDSDMAVTTLQTNLGQLIGTLQYMSPEQCAADHDIDTRSDVYSLGVVLYELLTGQLPYTVTRSDLYEAARIIREESPARLSAVDRTLRGDLETITLKALEKDRTRRYQSAAELGGDIGRFLRGEPILARPASVAYQVRILARRHKALIAMVVAVAAGLILAVIGTSVGLYRATQERDRVKLAERRARDEARRAVSAAEFLRETLLSANPVLMVSRPPTEEDLRYAPWEASYPSYLQYAGKPGQTATVADVLEAAGARLSSSFPNDGVTRADMLHLIGNTLVRVGRPERGEALLRQALGIRQRVLGPNAKDTIAAAVDSAGIAGMHGRFAEAVALLQPAHESCRTAFGPTDPRTLHVLRNLTSCMVRIPGRVEEAIRMERGVVDQLAAGVGAADALTLVEQGHLATLLQQRGDLEEAERLGRGALAGLRGAGKGEGRLAADTALRLARVLNARGAFDEAETLTRETIAFYTTKLGRDHPRTAETARFRLQLLVALGRLEDAEALARSLIESETRVFGPDSLDSYQGHATLARIMLMRGSKVREAEEHARMATALTRMTTGIQEDNAVSHAITLAAAHGALGDPKFGLSIIEPLRKDPPVNSPWVLAHFFTVEGDLERMQRRPERAKAALERAWVYVQQDPDPSHLNRLGWYRARLALAEATGDEEIATELRGKVPPGLSPAEPSSGAAPQGQP